MTNNEYLILFPNCKLVKGFKRSALCDLQRGKMHLIPNDMFDFLSKNNGKCFKEILDEYNSDIHDTIFEYVEFLESHEFIFSGSKEDTKRITDIENDWNYPGDISNAIYEHSPRNEKELNNIIYQLNSLRCSYFEFVSYKQKLNITYLQEILNQINSLQYLTNISLVLPYVDDYSDEEWIKFTKRNLRIDLLTLHSSPSNTKEILKNGTVILKIQQTVDSRKCCGQINKEYFVLNLQQFSESQSYNSCLNQKIAIDSNGEIKNCPSMRKSFGNISNTTLEQALNTKDFKNVWSITKNRIEKCKDCEFRLVCTDCRAYIDDPSNIFSPPLKCGYSPYTNKWEDWSVNPLKQKAIEYYKITNI